MEKRDRAAIDQFCKRFVIQINMLTLWPQLLENEVFNRDDVNIPKWESNLRDVNTVRDILMTVKTRGPKAFNKLVRSLRQTNQHSLADNLAECKSLEVKEDISGPKNINQFEPDYEAFHHLQVENNLEEYYEDTTKPLQINVAKSGKFQDTPGFGSTGCYRMRSKPRGYVLLITNIKYIVRKHRTAAHFDEANLKQLFEDMGFEVTSRMNLTGEKMKEVVQEFSCRDFKKVDSCFVVVSAHGSQSGVIGGLDTQIEGVDYGMERAHTVLCSDIIDFFATDKCTDLEGKPKIFIFQACREGPDVAESPGYRVSESRIVQDGPKSDFSLRNYSDILVAQSTFPGHVSYRSVDSGSWYIQIICQVFMAYACKTHILDLFNMVDERLKKLSTKANGPQTSTVKSVGFNKACYLNPGLFEDT